MMQINRENSIQSTEQPTSLNQVQADSHDVIYALRTAHQHQSHLLILADQKANALVGILALLITVIFTRIDFLTKASGKLLIPIGGFLVLEVVALLLAIFVIMPKTIGHINPERIENIPNIFFFGFFTCFEEDEYLQYLSRRLDGDQPARYHLARDLYQIGSVLKKKYTLLKYAYTFALAGVILLSLSTLIFICS